MHALYVNILLPLVENTEDGEDTAAPANKYYSHVWNTAQFQSRASLSHTPLSPAPFTSDKVCNYVDLLGNFIPLPCNSQYN